jgi:hypothetical protein
VSDEKLATFIRRGEIVTPMERAIYEKIVQAKG